MSINDSCHYCRCIVCQLLRNFKLHMLVDVPSFTMSRVGMQTLGVDLLVPDAHYRFFASPFHPDHLGKDSEMQEPGKRTRTKLYAIKLAFNISTVISPKIWLS